MDNPLITVIMSVYNTDSQFLKESISSILSQTESNFEFIIIDDASKEDVRILVNTFNDNRIMVIRNKNNIGLTSNLNKGIEIARGKYIARMDADDISLPDRFEKQISFLEANPRVGVLGTSAVSFGEVRSVLKPSIDHDEIKARIVIDSPMIHPSVMMKTKLLKENLYNEKFKVGQDYELWSRLVWKTEFANLSDYLLKYRIHNSQITSKKKNIQSDMANKVRVSMLKEIYNDINQLDIDLIIRSSTLEILNNEEIIKLRDIYNTLIEINMKSKKFSQNELTKIFSESLDRALYILSKENRKFPIKNVKLSIKHHRNKFSLKKYFGLWYYPVKKIVNIIGKNK